MPLTITDTEYFEIDGVAFYTRMPNAPWYATDLSPLWDGPDIRGGDLLLPGASGQRPRPRRPDLTKRNLPLVIVGDHDIDGNAYTSQADVREQLWENVSYLRGHVVDPLTTGDGTRYLTLFLPNGDMAGGRVTVYSPLNLTARGPAALDAILSVSLPDGALELIGS